MGVPLESAVRAATLNPAHSIGIDTDYSPECAEADRQCCPRSTISWIS